MARTPGCKLDPISFPEHTYLSPAQRYNALLRDASGGERLGSSSAMLGGGSEPAVVLIRALSTSRFSEPENLAVFVCENVLVRGMPILYVSHDADGDWQFLCGGEHPDQGEDSAALVCLREIVDQDPSLNQLAGLCAPSEAVRDHVDAPWRIHDRMEDIVRENVDRHACHVMKVDADDEGSGFAYSIGLAKTYGQPELICFGLAPDTMHWLINEIRDRMAAGATFRAGQRISDLIEGYECELRPVHKSRYNEFLGYALWFYGDDHFDTLQIVWPDKKHRFPWDEEYALPAHVQVESWLPSTPA